MEIIRVTGSMEARQAMTDESGIKIKNCKHGISMDWHCCLCRIAEEKLDLISEAWRDETLTPRAFKLICGALLFPEATNQKDVEWAHRIIGDLKKFKGKL